LAGMRADGGNMDLKECDYFNMIDSGFPQARFQGPRSTRANRPLSN
jgi:hypothetical protein